RRHLLLGAAPGLPDPTRGRRVAHPGQYGCLHLSTRRRARLRAVERPGAPQRIARLPLIGREQELVELRHILALPTTRLVTLTGPGGCGKTRLALELIRSEVRPA